MTWAEYYPEFFKPAPKDDLHDDPKDKMEESKPSHKVDFLDIGCGYGGLLGTYKKNH